MGYICNHQTLGYGAPIETIDYVYLMLMLTCETQVQEKNAMDQFGFRNCDVIQKLR